MNSKIIIVAEPGEKNISMQSRELISLAQEIQNQDPLDILIIITGHNIKEQAAMTAQDYNINTLVIDNKELTHPNPELLFKILSETEGIHEAQYILFPHSIQNAHCAGMLAIKTGFDCVSNIESFNRDSDFITIGRSIFNGKLLARERIKSKPVILTVRGGSYPEPEKETVSKNNSILEYLSSTVMIPDYGITKIENAPHSDTSLNNADVIISAGRGVGSIENIDILQQTANLFKNSALGASRIVCELKWLPFSHQVGATGKTVLPKLYMACGISGSMQHIAGMKGSQIIVAINSDPNAAIQQVADYIIIEDLTVFLPHFIEKCNELDRA